MRRLVLPQLVAVVVLAIASSPALAGPLNPPAAPSSTPGPEPRIPLNATNTPGDSDSVYRITQPGSYYLTGNVQGEQFKTGIEIAIAQTGEVTIDLSGFQLKGGADTFSGIDITGPFQPFVNIRNGGVFGWDGAGIDLTGMAGGVVEGVVIGDNYGTGLIVTGAIVRDCTATINLGGGFNIGDGTTISNCRAANNAGVGIKSNNNGLIVACTATNNTSHGIEGFLSAVVESSSASNNGGAGIFMNTGATIIKCTVRDNTQGGMHAGSACVVSDCMAYDNTLYGIYTAQGGTITGCVANGTTGNGFFVAGNATISNSTAIGNSIHGISAGGANLITNCNALYNGDDGINASLNSNTIRGNTCTGNGTVVSGSGILAAEQFNRIEDNTCIGNTIGIDVDDTRNIIVRNTCANNSTNWTIVANNVIGPIVDRSSPGSAAVSGNTAPSSLGTTEANANFTY